MQPTEGRASTRPSSEHDWRFLIEHGEAHAKGWDPPYPDPRLYAVCARCGLIRSKELLLVEDDYIWLPTGCTGVGRRQPDGADRPAGAVDHDRDGPRVGSGARRKPQGAGSGDTGHDI